MSQVNNKISASKQSPKRVYDMIMDHSCTMVVQSVFSFVTIQSKIDLLTCVSAGTGRSMHRYACKW